MMVTASNVNDAEKVMDDAEAKNEKDNDGKKESAEEEALKKDNDDKKEIAEEDAPEGEAVVAAELIAQADDSDMITNNDDEAEQKDEAEVKENNESKKSNETMEEALKLAVIHGNLGKKGRVKSPSRKPKAKRQHSPQGRNGNCHRRATMMVTVHMKMMKL